jgi:hypothetical protein
LVDDYKCACRAATPVLSWQASPACISGPQAAANAAGVCRVRRRTGSGSTMFGWIASKSQPVCYIFNAEVSPGGGTIDRVAGFSNSTYAVETLCQP